jgi:hypothetical protein
MSNSGKIWDVREAYKKERGNQWSRGSGRGFACSGVTPSTNSVIDVVTLSTAGNSTDYGDLYAFATGGGGYGSTTRGVVHGGEDPGYSNKIQYFNFSSTGNSADFGDSTTSGGFGAAHSNNTRGIVGGFYTPNTPSPHISNVIEFVTIANTGNATDFGDLGETVFGNAGYGNNTKWFKAGGSNDGSWGGYSNRIDTVTIATTGNSTDYADLNTGVNRAAGFSSTTRGITTGGGVTTGSTTFTNLIQQNDLSSGATGTDFGDLTAARGAVTGVDNSIRGASMGGMSPSVLNTIDFVTIATLGDATDFGDLTSAKRYSVGVDDSNAGLDFSQTQRPSVTYMPGSGRMLLFGGYNDDAGAATNDIDMITIPTTGNAVDFGTMTTATRLLGAFSDRIRGTRMGGVSNLNSMETILFSSFGNTFDFGDLTTGVHLNTGLASVTRGINAGGITPSHSNVISYVTIASASNATDFGDLTAAISGTSGASSSTRGIFAAGDQASPVGQTNVISYITIASTGNATDFGDTSGNTTTLGGTSSSTRAVYAGGSDSAVPTEIQYVTIASTGNTTDFGDLTEGRGRTSAGSNSIRAVYAGGTKTGAPAYPDTNVMDYITIASTGNAADFGDLTRDKSGSAGCADNHGGLQA